MEKTQTRRDPSIFKAGPPLAKAKKATYTANVRTRRTELVKSMGVPDYIARTIANKTTNEDLAIATAKRWLQGCVITGLKLTDRSKKIEPLATVWRTDGSFVCQAAYNLTQEGAISDATLIQFASIIHNYHAKVSNGHQPNTPMGNPSINWLGQGSTDKPVSRGTTIFGTSTTTGNDITGFMGLGVQKEMQAVS